MTRYCKHCNCELTPENWYKSFVESCTYICRPCMAIDQRDRNERRKLAKQDRAKYQAEFQDEYDKMTDEELVRFQNAGQPEEFIIDKLKGLCYNRDKVAKDKKWFTELLAYIEYWTAPMKIDQLKSNLDGGSNRFHYKQGIRDCIMKIKEYVNDGHGHRSDL